MRALFVAAAAALCSFGASAQQMKPGLWEISTRVGGAAGSQMAAAQAEMAAQMKNMPPEQRKMMEEMMAKQGMRMGPGAGGGTSMRMCVTPEMARRDEVPMEKGDCKMTSQQRTGSTVKAAFSCTNPPSTGEAMVTFTSSDAYTSKVTVKTVVDGKPETMNVDSTGRWLAADCGTVKPQK